MLRPQESSSLPVNINYLGCNCATDASASEDCNARLMQHFGIQAVPATFLIDAEGTVVALGVHPLTADHRDLELWLRKLLPPN